MPGFGTGVTVWFCSCLCRRHPVLGASAISLMGWSLRSVWGQNLGLSTVPHNQLLVLQVTTFSQTRQTFPLGSVLGWEALSPPWCQAWHVFPAPSFIQESPFPLLVAHGGRSPDLFLRE